MIGLNFPSNHLAFLFKAEMAVDLSKTNKEECVENELKQIGLTEEELVNISTAELNQLRDEKGKEASNKNLKDLGIEKTMTTWGLSAEPYRSIFSI